jgi:hypothetical protein
MRPQQPPNGQRAEPEAHAAWIARLWELVLHRFCTRLQDTDTKVKHDD